MDYLAPEMASAQHQHDYRVDIWSIGVLIFELLTGKSPFSPASPSKNMTNLEIESATKHNIKNQAYSFPSDFPLQAKQLVKSILVSDPTKRPSIDAILAHRWLAEGTPATPENPLQYTYNFGNSEKTKQFYEYVKGNMHQAEIQTQTEYKTHEFAFKPEELETYLRPDSIILDVQQYQNYYQEVYPQNLSSPLQKPANPLA